MPPRSSLMNAVVARSRVERLGARGEGPGRGGRRPRCRLRSSIGTNTCTPLAPLVLTAPASPASASAWRTRCAARDRRARTPSASGRVEVEHEMGRAVQRRSQDQRRVVLDRALVGEPQQRAAVVAQRVVHLALRGLGPDRDGRAPSPGVYFGHVLLHERGPGRGSTRITDSGRSRSPAMIGVAHRVQVVDEVALGRAGAVEQRLVEVGQRRPRPARRCPACRQPP